MLLLLLYAADTNSTRREEERAHAGFVICAPCSLSLPMMIVHSLLQVPLASSVVPKPMNNKLLLEVDHVAKILGIASKKCPKYKKDHSHYFLIQLGLPITARYRREISSTSRPGKTNII